MELEKVKSELVFRQWTRNLFGRAEREDIDRLDIALVLNESYEDMVLNIHNNVLAAEEGKEPLIERSLEPTYYVNREGRDHKEYFYIGYELDEHGHRKQPDFIEDYTKTRDAAYE